MYQMVYPLFKMRWLRWQVDGKCMTGENTAGWILPQCTADAAHTRCCLWSHKQTGWIIFTSVMLLTMCWKGRRHITAAAVNRNEAKCCDRSKGVLVECTNKLQKGCLSVLILNVTWSRSCDKHWKFRLALFGPFRSGLRTKRTADGFYISYATQNVKMFLQKKDSKNIRLPGKNGSKYMHKHWQPQRVLFTDAKIIKFPNSNLNFAKNWK